MAFQFRPIHVAFVVALAAAVGAVAFATSRIRGGGTRVAADSAASASSALVPAAGASAPGDSLGTAAKSALDRGNAEFRAGRYESALAHYRAAAKAAPQSAAPYFGVFMVAKKLGNAALADSARAEMSKRIDTSAVNAVAPHPTARPQ